MPRVLILGGGFGGIATAVALREQVPDDVEISIVDRRAEFVMGLRKTWYVLGISPLAYGERHLSQLAGRGITLVNGQVEKIDPQSRTAVVDGRPLVADALVVALGAQHAMDAVPGLAEHGLNAWSREGLEHVQAAVDGFRGGRVAIGVFGVPHSCPPAPYELALLLADRLDDRDIDGRITVFTPPPIILPILGKAASQPLESCLEERGIAVLTGRTVSAVETGLVRFDANDALAYDILLAVPPHRVPSVLVDAGLAPVGGWVAVDRHTLETGYDDVYAIGDCTAIGLANGMALPKAGAFAEREGIVVAARIAARLRGEEPAARYDGSGACFLEMGGGEASMVGGDFYADPPRPQLTSPSEAQRVEKERFESDRLARWFGG